LPVAVNAPVDELPEPVKLQVAGVPAPPRREWVKLKVYNPPDFVTLVVNEQP
jgi:hypothetical protein